jgi:hypothetical protein
VTVQDVDNALKIRGKTIAALKGKTTRNNPNLVTEDFVNVPTDLLMHNEVFLTLKVSL